jgi:hypothetical protein
MEKISKNKRGRPELHKEIKESLLMLGGDLALQTKRTLHNEAYLVIAFGLLKDNDAYTYLLDQKKEKIYKKTILQHIGRIAELYNNQIAVEIADVICKKRYNTAQAIDFIKRFRKEEGEDLKKNKVEGALKKVINIINNSILTTDELQQLIILIREIKINKK